MSAVDQAVKSATISECGLYRYELTRRWGASGRMALFIMLNPSTADAELDDPTIVRCINFAEREGCDGLRVVNVYALRSTDPKNLWSVDDPVGPDNDEWIKRALAEAERTGSPIIAAWGAHAKPHRVYRVKSMPGMERATALSFTKAGAPGHPLYIKGDAPLMPLSRVAS